MTQYKQKTKCNVAITNDEELWLCEPYRHPRPSKHPVTEYVSAYDLARLILHGGDSRPTRSWNFSGPASGSTQY